MRHKTLSLATASAAALLFIAVSPAARATATLTLTSGTDVITINEGSTTVNISGGCTAVTCSGSVVLLSNGVIFSGTIGNWTSTVEVARENAPSGNPLMDLGSSDTVNSSGGALTIDWTGNGFLTNFPGFNLSAGPSTGGTLTYAANLYLGTSAGTKIGTLGPVTLTNAPTTALNGSFSAGGGNTGTLTEEVVITSASGGAFLSDDLKLSSVPEPTSILLLGGVLALAGRSLRKKYQKAA